MKVKTMRRVFLAMLVLVVVLFPLGWMEDMPLISGISMGILLAGGVCFWIFWRCPSCGKNLGTLDAKHCPHCGAKLE